MGDKIYTRQGDDGSTQQLGGKAMRKCDPRVDAMGTIDELSSAIGLCLAVADEVTQVSDALATAQQRLFELSSALVIGSTGGGGGMPADCVTALEGVIDAADAQLPALTSFIAPGGCELAARLHVARTVCRRAERGVVALADSEQDVPPLVLGYLNRLSDGLFTLARLANKLAGVADVTLEA